FRWMRVIVFVKLVIGCVTIFPSTTLEITTGVIASKVPTIKTRRSVFKLLVVSRNDCATVTSATWPSVQIIGAFIYAKRSSSTFTVPDGPSNSAGSFTVTVGAWIGEGCLPSGTVTFTSPLTGTYARSTLLGSEVSVSLNLATRAFVSDCS